jgi:hypothetical protein
VSLPSSKSEWRDLALELFACCVACAFVGGAFGLGFVVVKRLARCFVEGV